MSVRTPAFPQGELPNLTVEELNFVFDLVRKGNVSTEEAYQRAMEIAKNKQNGNQRHPPKKESKKDVRKTPKKPSGSINSTASLTSISAPMEIQQKSHIYGVCMPGGRRTLQIDFVAKTIAFFSGGQIHKSFSFLDLRSYDVDENIANEVTLRFENESFDINTDSTEERYGLERLLSTILELNDLERIGVNLNPNGSVVAPQQVPIKKGELMKRGNTAIPVWAKRVVKIQSGEFCFYRSGDAVALNVVRLWEGNAKVKGKGNDGIVIQMRPPDSRTFFFRVCSDGHQDSAAIKDERDSWLRAFKKACLTRRSTLKLSKDQLRKLNEQYNGVKAKPQSSTRSRLYIAEDQFTSKISPVSPGSSAGSIGYSTGRSTESFTETRNLTPDPSPNPIYEFVRDDVFHSSSDEDSGEFEDDVVYNNVPGAYRHEEAEVMGFLDDVISEGSVSEVPTPSPAKGDPPAPCQRVPRYAKKITPQAPPSKDSAPNMGIVITAQGQEMAWKPDTNDLTELPTPAMATVAVPSAPAAPPPPAPPPPPPPPGKAIIRDCSNRTKLKHIFWQSIAPNRLEESIWRHSQPDDIRRRLCLTKLEEQFAVGNNKTISSTPSPGAQPKTLITGKRAYNLGIFLKGLKTRGAALVESISQVYEDDSALSVEQVATIRRFQPSVEDCEMYGNFKGDKSLLGEVDQFMMELCHVKELENRLDLTQLLWDFPYQLHCLEPTVEQMTRTCNQLLLSKKFARLLQYILCLGNYLNSSSPSGSVVQGFKLTALNSLESTRGKDRDYSLLHYLVEQVKAVEPELLTFAREIPDIAKCSDTSTKALEVEIEVLKNQLALIRKTTRSVRAGLIHPKPYEHQFLEEAEKFAKDHEKLLQQLQTHHNQLHHLYQSVLTRFGQPPETSSNELFAALSDFMEKFEAVHQEITAKSASISSQKSQPASGQKSQPASGQKSQPASGQKPSKARVPLPQKKS